MQTSTVTAACRDPARAPLPSPHLAPPPAHPPAAPACRLDGVFKTYRMGRTEIPALTDLTLDIDRGSLNMLMGPSGSGKSTLLNILGCIETADSGSVEVLGQRTALLKDAALTTLRRDHIGFIFQNFSLIPVLNAAENVEYPLVLAGIPARERAERVARMLAAVGLSDRAGHKPGELSGGQRQRVAIARALIKAPALVIADEPTANLDSRTGQELMGLMRAMQAETGATFIVASHDPMVETFATRRIDIHDGRIASTGDRTRAVAQVREVA